MGREKCDVRGGMGAAVRRGDRNTERRGAYRMKRRSIGAIALLGALIVAGSGAARAQELELDSSVRQLEWGSIFMLVQADTSAGVIIWASTSSLRYHGTPKEFYAGFDPNLVVPWLASAEAVVGHERAVEDGSPATGLETPVLVAGDSDGVQLVRLRKGSHWDDHVHISLLDRTGKESWGIRTTRDEAKTFLKVLFDRAIRSQLSEDAPMVGADTIGGVATAPVLMTSMKPNIPRKLQGLEGEVLLGFVVDSIGMVDPSSLRVELYSDPRLVPLAAATIEGARYLPGTVNGHPVSFMVRQRVAFTMR